MLMQEMMPTFTCIAVWKISIAFLFFIHPPSSIFHPPFKSFPSTFTSKHQTERSSSCIQDIPPWHILSPSQRSWNTCYCSWTCARCWLPPSESVDSGTRLSTSHNPFSKLSSSCLFNLTLITRSRNVSATHSWVTPSGVLLFPGTGNVGTNHMDQPGTYHQITKTWNEGLDRETPAGGGCSFNNLPLPKSGSSGDTILWIYSSTPRTGSSPSSRTRTICAWTRLSQGYRAWQSSRVARQGGHFGMFGRRNT